MKKITSLFSLLIVTLPMCALWKTTRITYTSNIAYPGWGINTEDPNNVIVQYKGTIFEKPLTFTTQNIKDAAQAIDNSKIGTRNKTSVKNHLATAWSFLSNVENLTKTPIDYKKSDPKATTLDNIVNKKDYLPYYASSYFSQVLFGATILGLVGVAYWQRDIIQQYSRDALNTILTSETIKSKIRDLQEYVPTKELLQQGYSSFLNKLPAWPSFNPQ
jgi:hypothetical protein